jgi:hypothetical protein
MRSTAFGMTMLCAGLIVGGCGGGSASPAVASLPGHGGGESSSASRVTVAESDRDMVAFARCMRAHGVHMSDPFHIAGHDGLSMDLPPRDATTAVAYAACSPLIKAIIEAKAGAPGKPVADLAALTRYAECMRGRDIGMLDPTPQGELSLGNVAGITDDFGRYSPQFRTADTACRHLLPAGVHDDGTGP